MEKGFWHTSRRIEDLGMLVDTTVIRVFKPDRKIARVRSIASRMLRRFQLNRRRVSASFIRRFCGVCVSLNLGFALPLLYTRASCCDLSRGLEWDKKLTRDPHLPFSRQVIRDLQYWFSLTRGEGRYIQPPGANLNLHSHAADVGFGGKLGPDLTMGSCVLWSYRGLCTMEERMQGITLRELRAVWLLLIRSFSKYVSNPSVRRLLLHCDNQPVVYLLNSMVYASIPMMSELRKLPALLLSLGIHLQARWLPSSAKTFADTFSRMWKADYLVTYQRIVQAEIPARAVKSAMD